MLKQYFTDGLVQIAIVLSLLRTDLNNYINYNYVSYPEVQEIILGQTAAYTQTNFHNSYNTHLGSPEIYRKNIEPVIDGSILRDLQSFRHLTGIREREFQAFLLVTGNSGYFPEESNNQNQAENDNDENNNNVHNNDPEQLSSEDLEQEGQNLLNTLEESIGAIAPLLQTFQGTDPTIEDLDLIEVLWRQDIDLGVAKEVFDPNLRQELEREREIELQKERQKQKEQELLQKKLDEQRLLAEQRWLNDNFTQDGETGEWVPLGGNQVPPPPPAPDLNGIPEQEQFLSSFDNMPSLSSEIQAEQGGSYSMVQPHHMPPPYQGPQPIHNQPSQMYSPNGGQYTPGSYPAQQNRCPMPNLNTQGYPPQEPTYNNTPNNYSHSQHRYNHVQPLQQTTPQPQQFPRQASLEATWQDLVNILDLPQSRSGSSLNQTSMASHTTMAPLNNTGRGLNNSGSISSSGGLAPLDNNSSVLLQNVSMANPVPHNTSLSFNTSGMGSQSHRSPPHSTGLMSPTDNFNSSMPGGSGLGPLDWDNCGDFIFPNMTGLNQSNPDPLDNVDELLPDLITEDELEQIDLANMELSDSISPTPSGAGRDDASSDSAVSMGSRSSGSPEQDDFSEDAMSPFDGLEGATGGQDSHQFPKTAKFDPDDYKYSNSCSYSCGDSNSSNFSSSSNETGSDGQYGRSNGHGGGHFSPTSNGHINHNHTYPVKPGADPKDFRKHILNKEQRHKGPVSKDNKRMEELKIPFTLEQIVHSPVEEFNDMLTRHKLDDQQLQLIRDIRRRGKNKVAAQNCRKRKINVLETLEDDMTSLEKMRDKLLNERHVIDKQTSEMKEKLRSLYSEIFHSLRDEHGQPYDPARFSLQQSSDGDVFLVPRNYTMEDDSSKRRKNGDSKQ